MVIYCRYGKLEIHSIVRALSMLASIKNIYAMKFDAKCVKKI